MADHPLSPGGDTLVVLDTCALLPPRLSDVLFDLALLTRDASRFRTYFPTPIGLAP